MQKRRHTGLLWPAIAAIFLPGLLAGLWLAAGESVFATARPQAPETAQESGNANDAAGWEAEAAAARRRNQPGDRQKAISLYQNAAEAWLAQGDPQRAGAALTAVGQLLDLSGKRDDALAAFREAIATLGESAPPGPRAAALYGMAKMLAARAETPAAVEAFRKALALREQTGERFEQALILHNLASAYWTVAENEDALQNYRRALAIRQEIGDKPGLAYTHYGIAITHWSSGERQSALNAARESEAIWKELDNPFGRANVRNSMGLLYAELGDHVRAREAYQQAMALWKQAGSDLMTAYTRNNLGMLAAAAGRRHDARREYAAALPALEAANDGHGVAYVLQNQGDLALKQGQVAQAQALYERSIALKQRIGDRFGEAITRERIGTARLAAGDAVGAMPHFEQSLALHQRIGNRSGAMIALASMARGQRALRQPLKSLESFRQAIALAEADRGTITNEDLRVSYFTTVQDLFSEYIALLSEEYGRTKDPQWLEESFLANERSRARQLWDALASLDAAAPAGSPHGASANSTLRQERQILSRLRATSQRLQRLHSVQGGEAERAQARAQLDGLLRAWHDLRAASPASGNASPGLDGGRESLASLDQLGLPADTALLAFRVGPSETLAWRLDAGGIALARLPGEAALEALVRRYRQLLTAREVHPEDKDLAARRARIAAADAALDASGRKLSWALFGEILRGVKAARLVFVMDGVLAHVPVAALPQPFHPTEPMVERWEIASAPSATILAGLQSRTAPGAPAGEIAVVADPVFSADDSRMPARQAAAASPAGSPVAIASTTAAPVLVRLRFTQQEAQEIAAAAGGKARLFTGFDAGRELLTGRRLADASILHLATHAWVDEQSPPASAIAFSAFGDNGTAVDGNVRLFEIYNLKLAANLVVLSGCRTAGGGMRKGEGVEGLVRGFLHAGVPRVIASYWAVQDASTAEFMGHFYRFHLTRGVPAGQALRRAQQAARRTPHMQHPYYWAGFALEGDWR